MHWVLYEESIRSEVMKLEDKKMNYRITEEWLKERFGQLFGMIDEMELNQLSILTTNLQNDSVEEISRIFAHRLCDAVNAIFEPISTDVIIDKEGYIRKASVEKVSRMNGVLFHFAPMFRAKNSGVTELSELWLLKDGRFAEITSVCFVKDELIYVHRKFRKIVKHRKDIWFRAWDLVDSLNRMYIWYMESNLEK